MRCSTLTELYSRRVVLSDEGTSGVGVCVFDVGKFGLGIGHTEATLDRVNENNSQHQTVCVGRGREP